MLMRHLVKHRMGSTYQIWRHPESRIVSFFTDKFRIQPSRCDEPDFAWQPCHKVFLPVVGMTEDRSTHEIAEAFLQMTFDQLIDALPEFYDREPHTWPQAWSSSCFICHRRVFRWPDTIKLRMEDGTEALSTVPDFDVTKKTNPSSHLQRDFSVNEQHRDVLQNIYKSDYRIGGYERQPATCESGKSIT